MVAKINPKSKCRRRSQHMVINLHQIKFLGFASRSDRLDDRRFCQVEQRPLEGFKNILIAVQLRLPTSEQEL